MRKTYLSRANSRFWAMEAPVGDPTGGPAYGEYRDPATIAFGTAAAGSGATATAATAGLFGVGTKFALAQTLMTVGTAFSALSALSQGQQAKSAAEYNAQVANNNAVAARQQAEANAAAQARKSRLQLGSMRAAYGASGVGIEGSPMDMLEQSASLAELDRQNILYGGELRAGGYQATAGLDLMRGSSAESGSYLTAAGTALTGAAKLGLLTPTVGVKEAEVAPIKLVRE